MECEIWSLEFDTECEDYRDDHSWYIGKLSETILNNFSNLISGDKLNKWVIIALEASREDAEIKRGIIKRTLIGEDFKRKKNEV